MNKTIYLTIQNSYLKYQLKFEIYIFTHIIFFIQFHILSTLFNTKTKKMNCEQFGH